MMVKTFHPPVFPGPKYGAPIGTWKVDDLAVNLISGRTRRELVLTARGAVIHAYGRGEAAEDWNRKTFIAYAELKKSAKAVAMLKERLRRFQKAMDDLPFGTPFADLQTATFEKLLMISRDLGKLGRELEGVCLAIPSQKGGRPRSLFEDAFVQDLARCGMRLLVIGRRVHILKAIVNGRRASRVFESLSCWLSTMPRTAADLIPIRSSEESSEG